VGVADSGKGQVRSWRCSLEILPAWDGCGASEAREAELRPQRRCAFWARLASTDPSAFSGDVAKDPTGQVVAGAIAIAAVADGRDPGDCH